MLELRWKKASENVLRRNIKANTMVIDKKEILENICYSELVYGRINKKLNTQFSKKQIEEFV